MDVLFSRVFEIFSIEYTFSVIVASYLLIKLVDALNGKRIVPTWAKRLITCIAGTILFFVFDKFTDVTKQSLIASFFLAIFVYDAAIKAIFRKFKIGYRK